MKVSPIVGLTLVSISDTPLPLVSDLLNFTAMVKNGTPQRYEWTSSDNWSVALNESYTSHQYSSPGYYSMTVNASNELGYRVTSLNFTVYRRTGARLTYSQVPRTAVVGQTFVLSVSVEAVTDSLLACWLFLDDELVANGSHSAAVAHRPGHYIVSVTGEVRVDVDGQHRVTLLAADLSAAEWRTFHWSIDAFHAIVDVAVDPPTPAISTGSTTAFTARQSGGSGTVTYLWNFGDQSPTVDTGVNSSSPAHTFTQPGTYTVRCTASNNVSRVTGTTTLTVVDVISGVLLAYDGPTTLGYDTFIQVVVVAGTQVTHNISTPGATTLARSEDAVMVRYSAAGQFLVTVLSQNAISNGSASLTIYVVDASTLYVLSVGNASCGLPLRTVIVFEADVVCANTSDVVFRWSIPKLLDSLGRGLSTTSASFTAAGVYELTLTAWNNLDVRREYRATLCANESVPEVSYDPLELRVGISRISTPYLPAQHDIVFFPITFHCPFLCRFYWQFWDLTPRTTLQGFKVQHAFQTAGVFNVSLTVRRLSAQNMTYTTVVVQRKIEEAFLQAAVEASSANEPIEFNVTTKPNEVGNLTYHWWFYDDRNVEYVGNSSTIMYAFHGEGIRLVNVTVHNQVSVATAITSVDVCGKITGLKFNGCCYRVFNITVQFEAFVQTGQVSSYNWTLRNDEGVALTAITGQVFVYTFNNAGYYQIQLMADNPLSNQTVVDYFNVQVSNLTNSQNLQ